MDSLMKAGMLVKREREKQIQKPEMKKDPKGSRELPGRR
jgi:hypothetical protein